jgi:ABC-type dipeptide/oligopeptide/nickel transport system permease subunit
MKGIGLAILGVVLAAAVAAPLLSPHAATKEFRAFLFAPPMRPHVIDDSGGWHPPFVHPLRLASRLEQRYEEDRSRRIPLALFSNGVLVSATDETEGPWLLLGADSYGRDIFARILYGARTSLGVAAIALIGALLLGLIVGGLAGYLGGATDEALMRFAEFLLILPTMYVVLVLRAALPLVLPAWVVFALMAGIFALVGWPTVARGVRAIVAAGAPQCAMRRRRWGGPRPPVVPAPAPGLLRLRGDAGDAAPARIHPRRGDALVRRVGIPRPDSQLGGDAPGWREGDESRRLPLDPVAGRRHLPGRAGAEPRPAGLGPEPCLHLGRPV